MSSSRCRRAGSAGSTPPSVEVRPRMDDPVDPAILDELRGALPGLRARLRAGRPGAGGVRRVRTERPDAARVHRVVPRAAPPGRRRARPQPRPSSPLVTEAAAGLHRPAGSLAEDGWSVVLTPESAGWRFCGLRVGSAGSGPLAGVRRPGRDEVVVLPLAGAFEVTVDGAAARPRRAGRRVGGSERLPLRAAGIGDRGRRAGPAVGSRWRTARAERRYPVRYVPGIGGRRRAARRRGVLPRGAQLRGGRPVRGRPPDRGRGPDARRQLGLVSAAQARRGPRRARPSSRRSTTTSWPTVRSGRAWRTSTSMARPSARSIS